MATKADTSDTIGHWGAQAQEYDALYEEQSASGDWLRARQAVVLRLVGEGPGTALDVAMGSGRLVEALEQRGWTAWGIDGAPQMVALAHARVPSAVERLVVGRIEELPFNAATFDAVVTTGMFAYAADRAVMLAEMARVLRPGGRAVLSTANARSPTHFWRHELLYPVMRATKKRIPFGHPPPARRDRVPGRRGIERMFTDAGLTIEAVEFTSCGVVPDPLDRVFPRAARSLAGRANALPPSVRHLVAGQIVIVARRPGG